MLRDSLQKIVENCEGASAAIVMGFDGVAIDSVVLSTPVDVQAVGMEFSFVLGQVRQAAEILDVGGLEEIAIRSEKIAFLIRTLNKECFLGLALRPEGNLGKGRFLMRLASPDLLAQLPR